MFDSRHVNFVFKWLEIESQLLVNGLSVVTDIYGIQLLMLSLVNLGQLLT